MDLGHTFSTILVEPIEYGSRVAPSNKENRDVMVSIFREDPQGFQPLAPVPGQAPGR